MTNKLPLVWFLFLIRPMTRASYKTRPCRGSSLSLLECLPGGPGNDSLILLSHHLPSESHHYVKGREVFWLKVDIGESRLCCQVLHSIGLVLLVPVHLLLAHLSSYLWSWMFLRYGGSADAIRLCRTIGVKKSMEKLARKLTSLLSFYK